MSQEAPMSGITQKQTHLFTVRLWREPAAEGQLEFRGKVKHVLTGEVEYFRNWTVLEAFLAEQVISVEDGPTL